MGGRGLSWTCHIMPVPHHMAVELKSVRLTDIVGWIGLCQWQFCPPRMLTMCGGVCCGHSLRGKAEEVAASLSVGRAQGLALNILLIVCKTDPTHPKEPSGPKCL